MAHSIFSTDIMHAQQNSRPFAASRINQSLYFGVVDSVGIFVNPSLIKITRRNLVIIFAKKRKYFRRVE